MNEKLKLESALAKKRGWLLTPLSSPTGGGQSPGKRPTLKDWTKREQMSDGDINAACYHDMNIGVRTGGGLIVADADPGVDPELLARLEAIVTPTVRTGRDGRHFYFKGNGRNSAGTISEHLDVRGEGGQVVLPGSIHESGKPYTWIIHPDECEIAEYPPWLEAMAVAAKRIRKAPAGKRNDTLNRATFAAASAGAPTRELADAAADAGLEHDEIEATIRSATEAAPPMRVCEPGETMVPGEHFFLGGSCTVDQTAFCRAVWLRIPPGTFYARFGVLGEIVDFVFQPTDNARYRAKASQFLSLYAYLLDGRVYVKEYRNFSPDMGLLAAAAGPDYVENVEAITCYPLAGGPHKGWLVMGEHPTRPVTDHASFWKELLCDFPWKSDNDRNIFVSLLLSIIMRPLIDGPVPPYMISASQERTGKTKLVNEVLAVLYGRDVSNLALGDDEAELEKRLIARSFSGHTVLPFDNVRGKIDSPVLAAYSTSRWFSGRVLGASKTVEFPVRAITVLTANNPSMSGEIAKRMMQSRLESKVEHPENRTDFKHADLLAYLREKRPEMLGSLLAIAEMVGPAFILGGFEDWGRKVGGAMAAAGMPLSQEAFTQWTVEVDDETSDVRMLIEKWSVYPEYTSVDELLRLVKELGIMPRVQEPLTDKGQQMRLGYVLRAIQGRVFGAWKVVATGTGSRRQWRLVSVP